MVRDLLGDCNRHFVRGCTRVYGGVQSVFIHTRVHMYSCVYAYACVDRSLPREDRGVCARTVQERPW